MERQLKCLSTFELIKKCLCVQATPVPFKRIFSKAGQTTEKRNRLSSKNFKKIIFINFNTK